MADSLGLETDQDALSEKQERIGMAASKVLGGDHTSTDLLNLCLSGKRSLGCRFEPAGIARLCVALQEPERSWFFGMLVAHTSMWLGRDEEEDRVGKPEHPLAELCETALRCTEPDLLTYLVANRLMHDVRPRMMVGLGNSAAVEHLALLGVNPNWRDDHTTLGFVRCEPPRLPLETAKTTAVIDALLRHGATLTALCEDGANCALPPWAFSYLLPALKASLLLGEVLRSYEPRLLSPVIGVLAESHTPPSIGDLVNWGVLQRSVSTRDLCGSGGH
jgi:hypothetical protein